MTFQIIKKITIVCSLCLFWACGDVAVPKPYGYFRIDLPQHTYRTIDTLNLPYRFDLPKNVLLIDRKDEGGSFWIDLYYPQLNASIYCSYLRVDNNFMDMLEDSRKIVYKHSVKADGIGEQVFENKQNNVHGILYDLKGNTASTIQFFLTDSTKHFFRGALYFNNVPNKDSIAPMAEYIREDVMRIMESFEWKK